MRYCSDGKYRQGAGLALRRFFERWLQLAAGADAGKCDFSGENGESRNVGRGEAGSRTDHTIDIVQIPALNAENMVVVVSDPTLEQCGRARWVGTTH